MSEITRPIERDLIHLETDSGERCTHSPSSEGGWKIKRWLQWSVSLLIAAFCVYRIWVFRPIPLDDSPGALRPLLYRGYVRYVGLFSDPGRAFTAWSELCLAGLVTLALLALFNYAWRENLIRLPARLARPLSSPALFWVLLAFTLLFCRIPVLLRGELNPDESQFLVCANKLFYEPNFFHSVNTGTSGPFNIYPLMLPAVFGLSPDFASSRLIGLIAIFLSVFALYRALMLVGNERLARLAILPVAGTFALLRHGELVHNSSEHIPFLLVALAIYQGAKLIMDGSRHVTPSFFWIGFIASAAFFSKMQAVPIVVGIGVVPFAYLCSNGYGRRVWRCFSSGLVGLFVPILGIAVLCFLGRSFREFWKGYVWVNSIYASASNPDATLRAFLQYISNPVEVRIYLFTVFAIVVAYLMVKMRSSMSAAHTFMLELVGVSVAISATVVFPEVERTNLYAYTSILGMCAAPLYFLVLFRTRASREDPVRWFGLLAVVSVCAAMYSINKPHRPFLHYLLFLFIPFGAVIGYLFVRSSGTEECSPDPATSSKFAWLRLRERRLAFVGAALVLSLSCEAYLWDFQTPADFSAAPFLRPAEGYLIRYLTKPGSQIFVWGWDLQPFLGSGRVSSTPDIATAGVFQSYVGILPPRYAPTPATERLNDIFRRKMLRELQANPPALFIDAVGPASWFLREPEFWGFHLIPAIKQFVDQRYVHLIDLYGQRYFYRRDLAAKRDAEFNRVMPELACSPSAVLCSTRSITLPAELPATKIPAHAQIDIEFMPIQEQLGPATVFNSEKTPVSFQGLRLQHLEKDFYSLLIGVGDHWSTSKAFPAPQGKVAFVSIQLNGRTVTLKHNGQLIDEVHLSRPVANAGGPINVESWIGGVDPFSGKVQFVQILDLDKEPNRGARSTAAVQ